MNATIDRALDKGSNAERLSKDEALSLFELAAPDGIHRLGKAARRNRTRRFADRATYVSNVQINASNICEGRCRFCRYAKKQGDEGAYVLEEEEILSRIEALRPVEAHIVGGMNPIWNYGRYLALIRTMRKRWPTLHVKAFTAVEIDFFARTEGMTSAAVLENLKEAGMNAMPGGGAEVFSKRVRARHCPEKLPAEGWLAVHREAHRLGLATNATLLYGLDETNEERVDHLLDLRATQDESRGFSCFIPLPFQPGKGEDALKGPGPLLNLAVMAIARLTLDNFPHIKAYWPMIGLETAAVALSFGADDLDGTIGEERIAHAAGASTPRAMSENRMVETIRLGGYAPVERDGAFNVQGGGNE